MGKEKKVLLGMSGGVDSSVVALLLKKQGYEVIGAFMINFSETKNKLTGECNYLEDKKDAQKIAAKLDIPLKILNYEDKYKKRVIDPMFKSYKSGITPNPDSLCNKEIKFPYLWKEAKKHNCAFIATGHYAKIKKSRSKFKLFRAKDKTKDQTYFLYELNQKDLEHTLFPLGNYSKNKVRKIAKKNGFQNYDKKGTSGICFVGKIDMKSFLKQKIKTKKGKIQDPKGNIIGTHEGIMFYTIGERIREKKGLKINKDFRKKYGKLYVADKNKLKNILTIAPEKHPLLFKKVFQIKKTNWISKEPEFPTKNTKIKVRHLGKLLPARISKENKKILCTLKKAEEGIAEGQSVVIYHKNEVLGGGEIYF